MYRTFVLSAALVALLFTGNAHAGITVTAGPGGGNPAENLLFNQPGLILVGTTVQGATNTTDRVLDIMSVSGTTLVGNGGQARVERSGGGAFDGAMLIPHAANDLPPGLNPLASFTDLKFNVDATADGQVLIEVFINNNALPGFSQLFPLDDTGQNFFRITSTAGDVITKVTIQSVGNIIDTIEQIRLTPAQASNGNGNGNGNGEIPEPGTLLIWAAVGIAGALGFGGRKLRRRLAMARG